MISSSLPMGHARCSEALELLAKLSRRFGPRLARVQLSEPEDGSLCVEVRRDPHWRFLASFEVDEEESGWAVVSKEHPPVFGTVDQIDASFDLIDVFLTTSWPS